MAPPIRAITGLAELWGRISDPEAQDLLRSLRLARLLEANLDTPPALLGLAWRLVEAEHEAAGWEVQPGTPLHRCEEAATAARRRWPPMRDTILTEVRADPAEVVVIGAPAASRILFRGWDVLPPDGLELVLLATAGTARQVEGPDGRQVRVRPAGELFNLFEANSGSADLEGSPVRLPTVPLLGALAAGGIGSPTGIDAVVFAAAAARAVDEHLWDTVEQLAELFGAEHAPRRAAARLGLTDRLGLEATGVARLKRTLRRWFTA